MDQKERWLSVIEIAQHLGVQQEIVYTWIAQKSLPAHKVGRLWKFNRAEVDAWVRSGQAAARLCGQAARGQAERRRRKGTKKLS